MRRLFSFLLWLFSFRTRKNFFLRWLRSLSSHPASGETAGHLASQEGQEKSELAHFLSSLPEDKRLCSYLSFGRDSEVTICFGPYQFPGFRFTFFQGMGAKASYREFLGAVASSKIAFRNEVIIELWGKGSCKQVEAFADALHQSGNGFRKLKLECRRGSAFRFAQCVSRVVLQNNAIQDLSLYFDGVFEEMGKEVAVEFMSIIAVPHNLRILKSFGMEGSNWDGEGMEQLMKPFQGPPSVLENLRFDHATSDAQLEHISGMLASSTSLKTLSINIHSTRGKRKVFTRGFTTIAAALCSNQSLKSLFCRISSNMELKTLLNPFIPKNNNVQCNITLTKLTLQGSIGGKEGIETLVDLIGTNSSFLELALNYVEDLSLHGIEGIKNVLAFFEALKTNKALKRISFKGCKAVGGYKVLGVVMDLLLENQCIADIGLKGRSLEESGDVDYVHSALSKRKKVRLCDIVQGMANANPTSRRVFLCGNPYGGKTRLCMSLKKLKEFQGNEEISKCLKIVDKIRSTFKMSSALKLQTKEMLLERMHAIEVDSVLCNGIGITIWDMVGQINYHYLVMPNLSADGSCSLFLFIRNPMRQSTPSKKKVHQT